MTTAVKALAQRFAKASDLNDFLREADDDELRRQAHEIESVLAEQGQARSSLTELLQNRLAAMRRFLALN